MSKSVSMPVVIGVVVAIVLSLSVLAWHMFAPTPEPMAGKSQAEKMQALKQAQQELSAKDKAPGFFGSK